MPATSARVIGTRNDGGVITTEIPVYEWDSTTTANTTYMRYENTTAVQFLQRVTTKNEKAFDTWANRVTASYIPID